MALTERTPDYTGLICGGWHKIWRVGQMTFDIDCGRLKGMYCGVTFNPATWLGLNSKFEKTHQPYVFPIIGYNNCGCTTWYIACNIILATPHFEGVPRLVEK